jgi:anti-sigma B factor antagonist
MLSAAILRRCRLARPGARLLEHQRESSAYTHTIGSQPRVKSSCSDSSCYRPISPPKAQTRSQSRKHALVRYNGGVSDVRSVLTIDEVGPNQSGATVLAVAGELDLATIGALKDAVGSRLRPGSTVVLDLSALQFCDSTGLGAFVGLHRHATSMGARFALATPSKRIAELFSLSGIDQVVSVVATPDAVGTEADSES